jgi:hypothetical protein
MPSIERQAAAQVRPETEVGAVLRGAKGQFRMAFDTA